MKTSDYKVGAVIEAGDDWFLLSGKDSLSIVFDDVCYSHGEKIKNQPIKAGTRFVIESTTAGVGSNHGGLSGSPTTAIISELKKSGRFNAAAAKLEVVIDQEWSDKTLSGKGVQIVGQMKQVFV